MKRNPLRYSIAFILFVCLCVAGILAGYRAGFLKGYDAGQEQYHAGQATPRVYDVGNLIRLTTDPSAPETFGDNLDFSGLMMVIECTVHPDNWEALGGSNTMAPLPWLESLVVHATSDVHESLESFFADVSAVKLAAKATQEEDELGRERRKVWIANKFEAVATKLGKPLTAVTPEFDLIGAWDVQQHPRIGTAEPVRYDFVDSDTVMVDAPIAGEKPWEKWYSRSPGSLTISGMSYLMAMTDDQNLVLLPANDDDSFMVATRVESKASDISLSGE